MGQTLGVDSAIQAPRLLTTSSQGALFFPKLVYKLTQSCWTIYTLENYEPLPVVDTLKMTILWDFSVRTKRTIQANKPNIVIKHKQNKTSQLIDMSVPSYSNISAKESEKLGKYKDLENDITKMCETKTKTIPVIVEAHGMMKKGTQKDVNEIPGNLCLAEIQKIVLNSNAHTLRRTLYL